MQKNKLSQEEPLVSIRVVTYNQVNYIRACLDGILMQKTNFPFEIVVGEDCSTDGTREIVFEYEKKYPQYIKVITSESNVGVRVNSERIRSECKAKYIAICDGDDFWSDPFKLQKQVSFLESNPDYGMCYTDVNLIDENNNEIKTTKQYEEMRNIYSSGYIFWDLLKTCFINTLTVVVKREYYEAINEIILKDKEKYWFVFDYWWWMRISSITKVKFINERMATYRIHPQGISRNKNFYKKRVSLAKLNVIRNLGDNYSGSSDNRKILAKTLWSIISNSNIPVKNNLIAIKLFFKYFPPIPFLFKELSKKIKK